VTESESHRLEAKIDSALQVLARLEGFLTPTIEALKASHSAQSVRSDDHERRIRALERFRFAWPSLAALSLAVAAATLVVYLLAGLHHHPAP